MTTSGLYSCSAAIAALTSWTTAWTSIPSAALRATRINSANSRSSSTITTRMSLSATLIPSVCSHLRRERGDDRRVQLAARDRALKDPHCFRFRDRRSVGTIREERLEAVRDRDDAYLERDLLGAKAVRVAGPVESLVMVANDRQEAGEPFEPGEDLFAEHRVALEHPALVRTQLAGLREERSGEPRVADVAEERTEPDGHSRRFVEAKGASDLHRPGGDPFGVTRARAVVGCDGGGQHDQRFRRGL